MDVWFHNENVYPFVPQEVLDRADSVRAMPTGTAIRGSPPICSKRSSTSSSSAMRRG
jgi:hypothetical protein